MQINETQIAGLVLVNGPTYKDSRGAFSRLFCAESLNSIIGSRSIVQINHSMTCKTGTVRGLHFQYNPFSEMKLIRCIKGRVWDVAIDLRKDSSTFLKYDAVELSSESSAMIVIPEGFAHGFQVLEEHSELLYLHTNYYTPNAEGGLKFDDPLLDIKWPLPICNVSERDTNLPFIDSNFKGI